MGRETRWVIVVTVLGLATAAGVVAVGFSGSQPVRADDVSCDTGSTVRCHATLVNEDDSTGYYLAVEVVGYDENGDTVTTYTNDATGGGDGIASVPPGGVENVTIATSSPERVAEGDVRVVDAEPVEG